MDERRVIELVIQFLHENRFEKAKEALELESYDAKSLGVHMRALEQGDCRGVTLEEARFEKGGLLRTYGSSLCWWLRYVRSALSHAYSYLDEYANVVLENDIGHAEMDCVKQAELEILVRVPAGLLVMLFTAAAARCCAAPLVRY